MLNNNSLLMGGTGFEMGQPINIENDLLMSNDPLQNLIDNIVYEATSFLGGNELMHLNKSLFQVLDKYEIFFDDEKITTDNFEEANEEIFQKYLRATILEGKSERTIKYYTENYRKFMEFCCKPLDNITTNDIRDFLAFRQKTNNVSNTTLDNTRRALSAVFRWLHEEGYILRNPVCSISKIKDTKKVKKPFTAKEIEILRMTLMQKWNNKRNIAIFELLLSSGIRVGELVGLNISDVDLNECSMIVLGKGNKQRECYFNIKTQTALELYLESREDTNPALFVSAKKPYNRLSVNAVERMIREAGRDAGIPKVHPHRFRRTMATSLLNKGVPIEQVKTLLGHANLDTTTIYAMVDEEQLNWNHKKLLD